MLGWLSILVVRDLHLGCNPVESLIADYVEVSGAEKGCRYFKFCVPS